MGRGAPLSMAERTQNSLGVKWKSSGVSRGGDGEAAEGPEDAGQSRVVVGGHGGVGEEVVAQADRVAVAVGTSWGRGSVGVAREDLSDAVSAGQGRATRQGCGGVAAGPGAAAAAVTGVEDASVDQGHCGQSPTRPEAPPVSKAALPPVVRLPGLVRLFSALARVRSILRASVVVKRYPTEFVSPSRMRGPVSRACCAVSTRSTGGAKHHEPTHPKRLRYRSWARRRAN